MVGPFSFIATVGILVLAIAWHRDWLEQSRRSEVNELYHRLQKIASQVPGVVYQYMLRPDGSSCFPYASDGIRSIYRVSPTEVAADTSPVFAILHPDDSVMVATSIQQSAAAQQPWRCEYPRLLPRRDRALAFRQRQS